MDTGTNRSFDFNVQPATLVDLVQGRAYHQSAQQAYTFLTDGENEDVHLSYGELDRRARSVAALLQSQGAAGERALLLYPPGLDYIVGFLGCLYAGVIAVPAYPPDLTRFDRTLPRLQGIVKDSQATLALTISPILSMMHELTTELSELVAQTKLSELRWIATDKVESEGEETWKKPGITSTTLAFLQYSSGSTGTPKGVMLTHGNLLHNSESVRHAMNLTARYEMVTWLPIYHDMGLIGGILQPLYTGFSCTLMSTLSFLQWPLRWLKAISRIKEKSIISGGPNFAYDLCARKVTAEQKETLDLSNWNVAFSGAEPVRAETIDRFTQAFEVCGFRREFFYPCYGLAEATLFVSGGISAEPPVINSIDKNKLENNRAVELPADAEACHLVGCGRAWLDGKIIVANPASLISCELGEVGEIWIASQSVAQGYWNCPDETETTFNAHLTNTGEGPFLRTGDLGYLRDGELFVTGRLKDLIIIRGRNHYPQDIELTVENSHPALRKNSGAAFSVEVNNEERLVVVQEVRPSRMLDLDAVTDSIRQAIAAAHELQAAAVVLVKPRQISKTSSGKIQRFAVRKAFLTNKLDVVNEWRNTHSGASSFAAGELPSNQSNERGHHHHQHTQQDVGAAAPQPTREMLLALTPSERQPLLEIYLEGQVARLLELALSQVDRQRSLVALGLDSLSAVELTNHIQTTLGVNFAAANLLQGPNITELAAALADQLPTISAEVEAQKMAQILEKLDQLSEVEVTELLKGRTAGAAV